MGPPLDRNALISRLNQGAAANAAFEFLGARAFGDSLHTESVEAGRPAGEPQNGAPAAPEVARYRMGNGLRILLLRDTSAPVVSYHTWFGVGSRHEKPGKTGLAHLF